MKNLFQLRQEYIDMINNKPKFFDVEGLSLQEIIDMKAFDSTNTTRDFHMVFYY